MALWQDYRQSDLFRRKQGRQMLVDDVGRPFTNQGLRHWLGDLYVRAGFHKSGALRIFRPSMATLAYQAGIKTPLISRQLRHESVRHTRGYMHVEFPLGDLREAVERGMEEL